MSNIENLNVGEFIAVTGDKYCHEKFYPNSFDVDIQRENLPVELSPLKVVALGTPFILCEALSGDDQKSVSVDSRYVNWTKLTPEFVAEFCELEQISKPDELKNEEEIETEKENKKRCCPLCLESMIERRKGNGDWSMVCKECKVQIVKLA